jgi:hypothetical protein
MDMDMVTDTDTNTDRKINTDRDMDRDWDTVKVTNNDCARRGRLVLLMSPM